MRVNHSQVSIMEPKCILMYLNVSSSDDEDIIKRALEILDSLNVKYVYDEF